MSVIKAASAVSCAFLLSIGLTMTPPAEAQVQNGLVNVAVDIDDVLNNNQVTIPIAANIAANVCGVQVPVAVLAVSVARTGSFFCANAQNGNNVRVTR